MIKQILVVICWIWIFIFLISVFAGCQRSTGQHQNYMGSHSRLPVTCKPWQYGDMIFDVADSLAISPISEFVQQFRGVYYKDFFDRLLVEPDLQKLFAKDVKVQSISIRTAVPGSMLKSCETCNAVALLSWHDQEHRYPYTVPTTTYRDLVGSPAIVESIDQEVLHIWYDDSQQLTFVENTETANRCTWYVTDNTVSAVLAVLQQ